MLIGLTGGIASGKSIVASMFKELGAYIIDADQISREIMKPGTEVYQKVVSIFGKQIILEDQSIDRKKLADLVFGDREMISKLNECTHPAIFMTIDKTIENIRTKNPEALIIVDAALLVETGTYKKFDILIVVYADEATQVERLMKRDGLTREEALKRIASQMPIREKISFADFVIYNQKDLETTKKQVRGIFKILKACASSSGK